MPKREKKDFKQRTASFMDVDFKAILRPIQLVMTQWRNGSVLTKKRDFWQRQTLYIVRDNDSKAPLVPFKSKGSWSGERKPMLRGKMALPRRETQLN